MSIARDIAAAVSLCAVVYGLFQLHPAAGYVGGGLIGFCLAVVWAVVSGRKRRR